MRAPARKDVAIIPQGAVETEELLVMVVGWQKGACYLIEFGEECVERLSLILEVMVFAPSILVARRLKKIAKEGERHLQERLLQCVFFDSNEYDCIKISFPNKAI